MVWKEQIRTHRLRIGEINERIQKGTSNLVCCHSWDFGLPTGMVLYHRATVTRDRETLFDRAFANFALGQRGVKTGFSTEDHSVCLAVVAPDYVAANGTYWAQLVDACLGATRSSIVRPGLPRQSPVANLAPRWCCSRCRAGKNNRNREEASGKGFQHVGF